jgi:HD-like signal output (HDOD) protein
MKPSILFVDDEPNILDGLKRMLYPMRQEWDMTFSLGARQALGVLEKKPHDIIVTDLLMPDMDGGKLLEEIHARYPEIIRMVLSGHSGKKLALKASRYAHQFLAKPLQPDKLKRSIERVLTLREVLINQEVQSLINKLDTLPALPEAHRRIMSELNAPEPSLKLVADLISQDMGLSASIMKLVNSAFFGLAARVSSPTHAVNLLGLDVISGLVLTVQLFSDFDQDLYKGYNLDGLWMHCLNTGRVCKALARAEGFDQAGQDDLYVAGILHDVGKLALLCTSPELYQEVLAACRGENSAVWKQEESFLNCTHAELGAYLLSLWGFSEKTIPTVFYHHRLGSYTGEYPLQTVIVHAANALDHELNVTNPGYDNDRWQLDAMERLGFADRLPAWRNIAEDALKEASADEHEDTDS